MKTPQFKTPDMDTVLNQIFADQYKDAKEMYELKCSNARKDSDLLIASIYTVDLQKENVRLSKMSETMKGFVCKFLDSFEAQFDADPDRFVSEEIEEYIAAAKFMENNFSRPNHVYAVEEYLKTL